MDNECALKGMGWIDFERTEIHYGCTQSYYTCPCCKRDVCFAHSVYNRGCVECITRKNRWPFDSIQERYNQIYSSMTKACKHSPF